MRSISYSEREVFDTRELDLWRRATRLCAYIPERFANVRCHELARAVGRVLALPVEDGLYGFVDHSWLWTRPVQRLPTSRIGWPNILDVYAVGRLPMVMLVASEPTGLPHVGWAYRTGPDRRQDIDERQVEELANLFAARERDQF